MGVVIAATFWMNIKVINLQWFIDNALNLEYMYMFMLLIVYLFIFHTDTLIKAVHELSKGRDVSQPTVDFLNRMKRKLPPGDVPVKLFARNYDVDKYNSDHLMDMEGTLYMHEFFVTLPDIHFTLCRHRSRGWCKF